MNLKDAGIYDLVNIFTGKATISSRKSQGGVINDEPRLINIPAYQRPYRWPSEYISKLFSDYADNSEEYFIGSAVAVVNKEDNSVMKFDIVDGQQRLTTLYLLNYIRYLLFREYVYQELLKPYQPNATAYCRDIRECYVDMIGKNSKPFDTILAKIEELAADQTLDPNERVQQLTGCFKEQLCIAEIKETVEDTNADRLGKAHLFFDDEQMCLIYSRPRYNNVLKNAMCSVYLTNVQDTTELRLEAISDFEGQFEENYIMAMKTIFTEIWSRASEQSSDKSLIAVNKKAIELANSIISNMSICLVLTESADDANKLFEVLNARALKVEDLELIKNHFYKEYCTKSQDDDIRKDSAITELDELWGEKIFSGNEFYKSDDRLVNNLISYLGAVYLTQDKELTNKNEAKYKDEIEKKYSSKKYSKNGTPYSYDDILADFNSYYAVKLIFQIFGLKGGNNANANSLNAEQERKSITYKTLHLLNALTYYDVMPGLVNVIIASYSQTQSLTDANFETSFAAYLKDIINDASHNDSRFSLIHRCAYMLWVSSLMGKDYSNARGIAKRMIEKYGHSCYSSETMDFLMEEKKEMDKSFDKWLEEWRFVSAKVFRMKVLLLNLLLSDRDDVENAYKATKVTITRATLRYSLDAANIQLDHLEADKLDPVNSKRYYLSNDIVKRQKDVNGYIGNFMILDEKDNNKKNNVPLCEAMKYYKKIEKSWLVEDIKNMTEDTTYFDTRKKVPKEAFFVERTRRLSLYFKALLNSRLEDASFDVQF